VEAVAELDLARRAESVGGEADGQGCMVVKHPRRPNRAMQPTRLRRAGVMILLRWTSPFLPHLTLGAAGGS